MQNRIAEPTERNLIEEEIRAADERADRRERCLDLHGYGCARAECGRAGRGDICGLAEFLPTSDPARIVAPKESTMDPKNQPPPEHILQFFSYEHLPPHLQAVSKPFCDLARLIVEPSEVTGAAPPSQFPLPRNPERTVALRKLLESKDAAVRALVAK